MHRKKDIMNATINNNEMTTRNFSAIRGDFNVKLMVLRKKMIWQDRVIIKLINDRSISKWIVKSTERVTVVDNSGEEATIMHGVTVDKHSPLEGYGSTPYLSTGLQLVMRAKEEKIREVEEQVEANMHSLKGVEEEIDNVARAMAQSQKEFNVTFRHDEQKLDSLEKWHKKLLGWIESGTKYIESLEDDIRRIEAPEQAEADYVVKEDAFNTVHWKGVNDFGERLVIKMKRIIGRYNVKQLLKMSDKINTMRYGEKKKEGQVVRKAGKQLTFKHWLELWWLINRELAKKTGSQFYKDKVQKAKKMYEEAGFTTPKESNYKVDPDASFFGNASINEDEVIGAIDEMWPEKQELDEAYQALINRWYNK